MIPKELNHEYYFKDMDSCPIKEAFVKGDYVWNALSKKDELMNIEKDNIKGEVSEKAVIKGPVSIGKNTVVKPFVFIQGPTIIGEGCLIRSGSLIRPKTIIGNNCVVGHGAEVKNSIVFNFAKLSSNSFVGDCIIGKGGRVASGVILGNRRFDQEPVTIKLNGKKYETGIEKFGCVLGDYSRFGANAIAAPGTLIGPHTWIYGGSSVNGVIKEKSLVKLRQTFESVEKGEYKLEHKDREGKV